MSEIARHVDTTGLIDGSSSVELSANRTSLSFERTRMSADRTLMSIVRTALSLISFGFTIYQVFSRAVTAKLLPAGDGSARQLGLSLLALGVLMLIMGIVSHAVFGRQLTQRRDRLFSQGLLHSDIQYRATPTFVIALLLLLIGLLAIGSIAIRMAS
jgi:putative membrane protein